MVWGRGREPRRGKKEKKPEWGRRGEGQAGGGEQLRRGGRELGEEGKEEGEGRERVCSPGREGGGARRTRRAGTGGRGRGALPKTAGSRGSGKAVAAEGRFQGGPKGLTRRVRAGEEPRGRGSRRSPKRLPDLVGREGGRLRVRGGAEGRLPGSGEGSLLKEGQRTGWRSREVQKSGSVLAWCGGVLA